MKKYNFAILSAGHIAEKMAGTLSEMTDELVPYAIGARDLGRAKAMADKFGFEKSYGSYEELVQDENVDLVYVATPHSHHYEHVKLCLNHGKHVLCEKTFTVNAVQAKKLIALAKEKNLFLGEAVWTRFLPFAAKAKEIISQGVIGDVQAIQCGFGQPLTHKTRMISPELAGGALLDLGIYPLTLASMFLGSDVKDFTGEAVLTDEGVDAQHGITLKYKYGKMAFLSSSMTAWMTNTGVISGSLGHIILHDFWKCERMTICVRGREPYDITSPFEISGYEYEVRATLNALDKGLLYCEEMTWDETVRLIEIMDKLRERWGIRYPFE